MAAIGSSLFNLGIILLVFSAIIYIIKNKLNEMDKRISSLSSLTEELLLMVNNKNISTGYNITQEPKKNELVIVSDDEDEDEDDDDDDDDDENNDNHDDDDDGDDDDNDEDDDAIKNGGATDNNVNENIKIIESVLPTTNIISKEETIDEVNLLQSNLEDNDAVLGISFTGYDSIDDNLTAQNHAENFKNIPEPGIFLQNKTIDTLDEKEKDYNSMNVKELKKLVSEKGGKVSGKTKEELLNFLNNE
tara:strand:+ start:3070 stop:3810 length:741 start_codon:yes stop_codon:yes gene_type:complete